MGTGSKNKIVAIFTSRIFLLAALALSVLIAVSFARAFYRDYEIREQIKRLEAQVDELEAKKLESLDLLDYVKSDAYVEDVGRTQLGLKKPGERVIVIEAATSTGVTMPRTTEPSWRKWWDYFFKVR